MIQYGIEKGYLASTFEVESEEFNDWLYAIFFMTYDPSVLISHYKSSSDYSVSILSLYECIMSPMMNSMQLQNFLSHLFVHTPYSKISVESVEIPYLFISSFCNQMRSSVKDVQSTDCPKKEVQSILLQHLQFFLCLYNSSTTVFYTFFSELSMFPIHHPITTNEIENDSFYSIFYQYSCFPKEIESIDRFQLANEQMNQQVIAKNFAVLNEYLSIISYYLCCHSYNLSTINYISWLYSIYHSHLKNQSTIYNHLISDVFVLNTVNIGLNISLQMSRSSSTTQLQHDYYGIFSPSSFNLLDIQETMNHISFFTIQSSQYSSFNSTLFQPLQLNRSIAQQFLYHLLQYYLYYEPNELNVHTPIQQCSLSLLYQYISDRSMLHTKHTSLWWSLIVSKSPYSKFKSVLHPNDCLLGQFTVPKSYQQLLQKYKNSKLYCPKQCSQCHCNLITDYYKCMNCKDYYLCCVCEQQETMMVYQAYKEMNESALSCVHEKYCSTVTSFQLHDSYTHVFTHIFVDAISLEDQNSSMNYPSLPILPPYYDKNKVYFVDNYYSRPYESVNRYSSDSESIFSQASGTQSDTSSRYSLASFYSTMSSSMSHKVSAALNILHHYQDDIEKTNGKESAKPSLYGFIHLNTNCSHCQMSPIVGNRYICLNCSCELCESCYHQDIELGQGICSHGLGHIMIRIVHPILPKDQLRDYMVHSSLLSQEENNKNTNSFMNVEDIYMQMKNSTETRDYGYYTTLLNSIPSTKKENYSSQSLSDCDSFNKIQMNECSIEPLNNTDIQKSFSELMSEIQSYDLSFYQPTSSFTYSKYAHFLKNTLDSIKLLGKQQEENSLLSSFIYKRAASMVPSLSNTLKSMVNEQYITLSDPDIQSPSQEENDDSIDIHDTMNYFIHPLFTQFYPLYYTPSLLMNLEKKELNDYLDICLYLLLHTHYYKYIRYVYEFEKNDVHFQEYEYLYLQMIQSPTTMDAYIQLLNKISYSLLLLFNIDLYDEDYCESHHIESIYKQNEYNQQVLNEYMKEKKIQTSRKSSDGNERKRKYSSVLSSKSNTFALLSPIHEISNTLMNSIMNPKPIKFSFMNEEEKDKNHSNHEMNHSSVLCETQLDLTIQFLPYYLTVLPDYFLKNLFVMSSFLIRRQQYSRFLSVLKEGGYDSLFVLGLLILKNPSYFSMELFSETLLFYMSIVDCYSYSYKQDNSISLMVLESYPILYQFYEYLFEGYIHYNTYEYELMKIYDKKWIILDHIYQLSLFDSVCFHDILFIRSLLLSLL